MITSVGVLEMGDCIMSVGIGINELSTTFGTIGIYWYEFDDLKLKIKFIKIRINQLK